MNIVRRSSLVLTLAAAFLWSGGAQQETSAVTAFRDATVIDGTGAPAFPATVIVEGERIKAVGPDVKIPAGARVVDASGLVLMPGLFDLHTHITASGAVLSVAADWPKNLMAYLYCGVTSIADLGDYQENFDGIRRVLATHAVEGPRVALATRFSSPGGHGAESGRPDAHTHEVLTPREAHAAMAEVLRGPKPDLIKIFTDGWRYGMGKDMSSMDAETIAAIVEDAHKAGIPVITHTVTAEKARLAAAAGADIIGHSIGDTAMDPELRALMKSKRTTYVPTLAVYEPKGGRPITPLLADVLDPVFAKPARDAAVTPVQRQRFAVMTHNVALARESGIAVGAGTDAGMASTYHGWATLRELKLLVSTGMSPMDAITSATMVSARALRVDRDRGTIAAGKLADIVLVAGRPDQQIDDIEKIRAVYLGGREVDRAALKERIASPGQSTLPAGPALERLDDFEKPGFRALNGELWVNYADSGHDRSRLLWTRGLRASGNHTLLMQGRMAEKESPFVEMVLPLAAGGMLPVDARRFRGIMFEARGEGAYRLNVHTRGVRDRRWFDAAFESGSEWSTVRIEFSKLQRVGPAQVAWTGDDLLAIGFEISRAPGESAWLEIDNVRFFQ